MCDAILRGADGENAFSGDEDGHAPDTCGKRPPGPMVSPIIMLSEVRLVGTIAWCTWAPQLADWSLDNLVVRRDAYGSYCRMSTPDGPIVQARTVHEPLTRDRIIRHFRGDQPGDRVGIHVINPSDSTCRFVVVDIDAHGPEDDPGKNWQLVRCVAQRADSRGVKTLVFDSNGKGGYHVWCLFGKSVPSNDAWRFGKWLVHDWAAHGLASAPETFPKSPQLSGKGYGNWIRLPGHHHKRPHWTRVWDGRTEDREQGFSSSDAAIQAVLRVRGTQESLPLVPSDFMLPGEQLIRKAHRRMLDPAELDRDAKEVREALGFLGDDFTGDYDRWLRVGMALRQLGDQGLAIWHEWSSRSPKYDSDVLDAKWATLVAAGKEAEPSWLSGRSSLVGLGSIFKDAIEMGWKRTAEAPRPRRSRRRRTITIHLSL